MSGDIRKSQFIYQDIARFRTQLYDILIGPHGLTTSQAAVLSRLFVENDLTQSDLAKRLAVGTVTLGGLVDRLEARGLVERHVDPDDRRANRIRLTDAAYPLGRVMHKCTTRLNEIANADIPDSEVETLMTHLETVRENLLRALMAEKNGKADQE